MAVKKILIVTYYWPPSGGGGVQRWLKFVKYLPSFGWHPYVLTPENPSVEIKDPSLLQDVPAEAEVLKLPIWEPYQLLEKFGANKPRMDHMGDGKRGVLSRMATWVRGNLFIPDPRIFWVRPAVSFLKDFIKENDIKVLVTTGPPHSMHLVGLKLKRLHPDIFWIADFRDPWSEWDLLDALSLSGMARRRHQLLEKQVLQTADHVITIAPFHVKRFEQLGGRPVELITNGFDSDDFKEVKHRPTGKFTITHVGMVDSLRDPRPFLQALAEWIRTDAVGSQVKVEFIGTVNQALKDEVLRHHTLAGVVHFLPQVSHNDLLQRYGSTDVQLLVLAHTALAPGNLPGKIFEYMASGNFVLGIGPPDGDAADLLRESGAGDVVSRENIPGMIQHLRDQFAKWTSGNRIASPGIANYDRRNLTERLVKRLESI